jgi:hypothetical protein
MQWVPATLNSAETLWPERLSAWELGGMPRPHLYSQMPVRLGLLSQQPSASGFPQEKIFEDKLALPRCQRTIASATDYLAGICLGSCFDFDNLVERAAIRASECIEPAAHEIPHPISGSGQAYDLIAQMPCPCHTCPQPQQKRLKARAPGLLHRLDWRPRAAPTTRPALRRNEMPRTS